MKIKDKISGEVYEAEAWKNWNGQTQYVKKGTNGPIRHGDDVEILEEDKPKDTTDWEAFRREAAKDFMTAIIAREAPQYDFACRNVSIRVSEAIMWADELIKQLKEDRK